MEGTEAGSVANLIVIGAMKCGTSALHGYLDQHPEIYMSRRKELNFFMDEPRHEGAPGPGNWHRGLGWYASHFPVDAPIRGESSPGYTSPSYPHTASRIAAVVPHARLVYMVRDPVERALSQYRHHRADGSETRPLEQALLDSGSQYVARSLYAERLRPFLERFEPEQIAIVSCEDLREDRDATMRSLFSFLGVDDAYQTTGEPRAGNGSKGDHGTRLDGRLRRFLVERFRDDSDRLRALAGRDFAGWTV